MTVPAPPLESPPASRRLGGVRTWFDRWLTAPNPVMIRELRQFTRLTRTPIILATVTIMTTLLMASIGGIASAATEPANVGVALFHTFFSVAFFVVAWVAPAVAANTIAAERSGHTWEALLLTALGPSSIARGKFLASLVYIGMYIVMLAPVGALSFLFGGVAPGEVLAGFVLLGLLASLSVAFGLSVSSAFSTPSASVLVTLLAAVPLSLLAYLGLGVWLSFAAHDVWPAVPAGPPLWLPTAYVAAELDITYLAYLVVAPGLGFLFPAWFFYEVTVANMASITDDRSSGLRRWVLTTLSASTVAILVLDVGVGHDWRAIASGMQLFAVLLVFVTFVIAGEPLGPSRRLRVHWERARAGLWRQYFGPGLLRAASLVVVLGLLGLTTQMGVGTAVELLKAGPDNAENAVKLVTLGIHLMGFSTFVVGFTSFLRARSKSALPARLLLAAALFTALVGPWILMTIVTHVADNPAMQAIAALSPTYVPAVVFNGVSRSDLPGLLVAGAVASLVWGLLGLGLLGSSALRTQRVIAAHRAKIEQIESTLLAEDDAAA